MAQPPAEYPEARVRRVFPGFDAQKRIMEAWSGSDEKWRTGFVKLVEGGDDAELPRQIDEYLAGTKQASSSDSGPSDATAAEPGTSPADAGDDETAEVDDELAEALKTGETAAAFADAHPDRAADLLAAERAGKQRKTVIEHLEIVQRRHEREQADETP